MASNSESTKDRAEFAVFLAVVALGLFVLVGSFSIGLGAGYDRIGPRFFPQVVAAMLLLSGSSLSWGVFRRGKSSAGEHRPPMNLRAIATLGVALASSVLLLERAGFIPTATVLFWLAARAFESRRPWRDAWVGLVLSLTTHLAFTRGLGLALPGGFLGSLF